MDGCSLVEDGQIRRLLAGGRCVSTKGCCVTESATQIIMLADEC